MSKYPMVRLADAFSLQMGKTPSRDCSLYWENGTNKWLSISDINKDSKFISETKEYITDKAVLESGIKHVPENTVIMSFKLSIGKTAITTCPIYTNEAIMAFIPKEEVSFDISFLYHLFANKNWSNGSNKAVKGSTLNKASLSITQIPYPTKEEQKRISKNLDKIFYLIQRRKQQLSKFDELAKSRFLEMFGDPISNSKGWEITKLEDLGELSRGISKSRPRNLPELLGGKYPLVQTGDVANSELYITRYNSTYSELGLKQSKMWKAGTLCITIAANIAKTAILKFDACFPDSIVGFKSNGKTNQIFIHYIFSFFQELLESQAPTVAQKNINLQTLQNLMVICPPSKFQNDFESFIQQLDKSKFRAKKCFKLFSYMRHLWKIEI